MMGSPSRTLYEIGNDLAEIEALLLEIGGDVSDADVERVIDTWLSAANEELNVKVDRYASLIQELTGRAKWRKEESDRLAARARVDSNAADKLKARLLEFFTTRNIPALETSRFRVSVQSNSIAPLVLDIPADQVPEDFTKVKVEVDNTAIREAIAAGREIQFAHIGERGKHLRIR